MPNIRSPDKKPVWPLFAWGAYWIIHILVWGVWGWKESELFRNGTFSPNGPWWFDFAGHAWAGIMGAFNDLYLYSRSRRGGLQERRREMGDLQLTKCVVADVGLAGIGWEAIELLWDRLLQPNFAVWAAKAQKDIVDNVIDVVTNPAGALIGVLFAFAAIAVFNRWIKKKADEEETDALEIIRITEEIEACEDQLEEISRRLQRTQREFIIQHLRRRRERLRTFWKKIRKNKK